MREYDLIADWYATDRGRTIGVAEALAVAESLPPGSRILDVGCGNGLPITAALVNAGHHIIGLDSSTSMLAHFRVNVPDVPVVQADVRRCPFADDAFEAAVSWGMMFHLTPAEQSVALASLGRVLKAGAPFLFTGAEIRDADEAGITGTMNGVTFRYYAVPSYPELLAAHGFELVDVHTGPGDNTYFLARKS